MFAIKTGGIRNWLLVIAVIFFVLLAAIIDRFASIDCLSIQEKIEYATKILTTAATILIGLGVVSISFYAEKFVLAVDKSALAAEETTQLNVKKLLSERLRGAIQQLGNKKMETRLGAIYSLELIAKDSPLEHWTIVEILTAFIREKSPLREEEQGESKELTKLSADVQTALTIIGRRDAKNDLGNQKVDLGKTNIPGVNLREANLHGANLSIANLHGANLFLAKLKRANLMETNLQQASLFLANLSGANLREANLHGAILSAANLCGANLRAANLSGANLSTANLSGTNLSAANLSGANLSAANLSGAIFDGAKLQGADLTGAKNLELNQIKSAYGDNTTRLPEPIELPTHWLQ
jgi:uncharacterized protein YjbI with pentapeptide repeats